MNLAQRIAQEIKNLRDNELSTKVDKEAGKGLSTEDFSTIDKTKLDNLEILTDLDIKTAYENNADTNALTDEEKTNLGSGSSIGTPIHITTIQDKFNHTESAGITHGGDLTDNLNGTIDITDGEILIRGLDDSHSELYVAVFSGTTSLSLIDQALNIVYVDYNGGSLLWKTTDNPTLITITDKVPAYYIYRDGNTLHIRDVKSHNVDNTSKHQKRMFFTEREERASGGVISDAGTRNIAITASSFYFQLKEMTSSAFDTSGTDTFSRFYSDGVGGWTEQTLQTQVDNLNYDDGSGTLATLGNNKYGVEWFYLILDDTNSRVISLYGIDSYSTLLDAENATTLNNVPSIANSFGILIGKTIVEKNDTELSNVQSSFEATFTSSSIELHNSLGGLQGGIVNEYNHLTNAELAKLTGIETGAEVNVVDSVAGKTGVITLDKNDVGLSNVDNTSDLSKPISTATQTALDDKSDTSHTHSYLPLSGGTLTGDIATNSDIIINGATTGSVSITLTDDTATTITLPHKAMFIDIIDGADENYPNNGAHGMLYVDVGWSRSLITYYSGSLLDRINNTTLTGTTGVDGRVTVSTIADAIMIENRIGATRTFKIFYK